MMYCDRTTPVSENLMTYVIYTGLSSRSDSEEFNAPSEYTSTSNIHLKLDYCNSKS